MKAKLAKKQKGILLVEAMIYMVILGLIGMAAAAGWGSYKESANIRLSSDFVMSRLPGALNTYVTRTGGLTGVTKNDLVGYGLDPQTPWNDDWTVSAPVGAIVTLTFPLTSSGEADESGPNIVTALNNSNATHVRNPAYNAATDTLTVDIQGQ